MSGIHARAVAWQKRIAKLRPALVVLLLVNCPIFVFFAPELHASFRLARLAEVTSTTVLDSRQSETFVPMGGTLITFQTHVKAAPEMWLPSKRIFKRDEPAFLVLSPKLARGFISEVHPRTFLSFLWNDSFGLELVFWFTVSLVPLLAANFILILVVAIEHCAGPTAEKASRSVASDLGKTLVVCRLVLEAAAGASVVLLFAAVGAAAFALAISIEGQGPWVTTAIYSIYVALFASYAPSFAARSILYFLRSKMGVAIKELTVLALLFFSTIGLILQLARFVVSDRVTQMSGWLEALKEFAKTLFT